MQEEQVPQLAEKGVSPDSEAAQKSVVQPENAAMTAEPKVGVSVEILS